MKVPVALALLFATAAALMGGCGESRGASVRAPAPARVAPSERSPPRGPVPAVLGGDVYAADRPGLLSPVVRADPPRIYVPNSRDNTVDVIDPRTYQIVAHFATGALPQHVTPSYDLRTLWVDNDVGNSLTPIDPATGRVGRSVPVADPYNLYFAPDGRNAIVVAERLQRLDFRDPHTMALRHSLPVPCPGVDHMDFSANGRYALASCEFSAKAIEVDLSTQQVIRSVPLRVGAMPQDVKLSPDGRTFYIADQTGAGVWLIDAHTFRVKRLLPTGAGAHGLYVSRDSKVLYVSNRAAGSISLVSLTTQKVITTWHLPGGGSPDMGGLSADGKVLWLTGRYNATVYAISTKNGTLLRRIPVGLGPHGLSVFPQPGRYSVGHTGIFR